MGVPVSHGVVLAFFDFLKRQHPEVEDLKGISRSEYDALVSNFINAFPNVGSENEFAIQSKTLFLAITGRSSPFSQNYDLDLAVEIANDLKSNSDHFQRFRQINNHVLLFASPSDRLVTNYVRSYLAELHELSDDFADIYFIIKEEGYFDHGFKLRRALKSIPGIETIRNSNFPCLFVWSLGSHVVLPLAHLKSSPELLNAYLRHIFDVLEIRNRALDDEMVHELLDQPLSSHLEPFVPDEPFQRADEVDLVISYKREDRRTIERLVRGLEDDGHRTWFELWHLGGTAL